MNFEALNQGIYSLVMSVGVAVSSAFIQAPPLSPPVDTLQQSVIIESFNVPPSENYNLELPEVSVTAPEQTVEQPPTDLSKSFSMAESAVLPLVAAPAEITAVTVELPTKPKKIEVVSQKVTKTEDKKELAQVESKELTKASPSPVPVLQKLAANAERLFEMANEHRKNIGLAAFEKEEKICQIAEQRAPQVHDEVFVEGPLHKGFKALNLPYWATENIAAYSSIEQNFKFWITDAIHRKAIEGSSKYSCIACAGTSCSQIFTSFIPK